MCVFIGIAVKLGVRIKRRCWSRVYGSAVRIGGRGGGRVALSVTLLGGNLIVDRVVRPRSWPLVRITR